MWTLKIRTFNQENILNKLANKYDIVLYGYPLNSFVKNNKFYVTAGGNVIGDKDNVSLFLKELKKSKLVSNIEIKNDFYIILIEQPKDISRLYSNELIHIEPVKISNKFYQEYYLGSWDRKILSEIIKLKIKNVKIEILKFKKDIINNISIKSVNLVFTKKQKDAFKLAYEQGYYEFPRKSELETLSKRMKISISTYQAHLRKAEKKIMDFFNKYLN